jgi:hypothetical protein
LDIFQKNVTFAIINHSIFMETTVSIKNERLKPHIISWISELNDENLLLRLYQLSKEKDNSLSVVEITSPSGKGQLTDGFNIWGDEPDESIAEYRKKIWKSERSTW